MKNPRDRFGYTGTDTQFIKVVEKRLCEEVVQKNRSYFDICISMGIQPDVSVNLFLGK